ncbi:MAG TPA: hypothetical protein V6C76_18235 [Drouetiella sp.]
MGSEDYATSNPNPSSDEGSLAARRARLRGSLAKQANPPDPYKPDPYMASQPVPAPTAEPAASPGPSVNGDGSPVTNPAISGGFQNLADETAAVAAHSPTTENPANGDDPTLFNGASTGNGSSSGSGSSSGNGASTGNGGGHTPTPTLSSALFFASANSPSPMASSNPVSTEEKPSYFSAPEVESVPPPEPEAPPPAPTSRADRRRGGSAAASVPAAEPMPEPVQAVATPAIDPTLAMPSSAMDSTLAMPSSAMDPTLAMPTSAIDPTLAMATPAMDPTLMSEPMPVAHDAMSAYAGAMPPAPPEPVSVDVPMPPDPVSDINASMTAPPTGYVYGIQPDVPPMTGQVQTQAIEIMNNIDQAMSACAMNLSELQKIATEQSDALKGVAEMLQNQSFFEIGLNLNSLTESLSAALEPMKAVGELVPAIDQLVAVMESRESTGGGAEETTKLSREQLITNLAEQLSAGQIDPWTFKCAYMAVFPSEHPADLLHRLVDLLGTQRLSGDLFRSAYDAVQAPDPPPRGSFGTTETISEDGETRTIIKTVPDEAIIVQLEELKRTNEEFLRRNEEIQKRLEQKDAEFGQVLATKESELQEAQELLNSRWEEFNSRYDELTETLHKRDEVLQEREAELAKKDQENTVLRSQMEELRDQTKEMVADLQRQLSAKPKEEAPKQPGFFDTAPASAQQPQPQPAQQAGLFDAGPAKPLFGATDAQSQQATNPLEQLNPNPPQPAPAAAAPQPAQPAAPAQPNPALAQPMAQPAQNASAQAVPRPAAPTTPFVSGAGSYGSGVRAQVFEVIVRQALAGAPWREICAGPMQVNNISPEEVEAEVKRRQALLKK